MTYISWTPDEVFNRPSAFLATAPVVLFDKKAGPSIYFHLSLLNFVCSCCFAYLPQDAQLANAVRLHGAKNWKVG